MKSKPLLQVQNYNYVLQEMMCHWANNGKQCEAATVSGRGQRKFSGDEDSH